MLSHKKKCKIAIKIRHYYDLCHLSNILWDDVWLLWHYTLCHFSPILKLDIYICCIPWDQLSVSYAPCLTWRTPLCEVLSQIWVVDRFISFNEATVIHGSALFTASMVCRSTWHGSDPTLPYLCQKVRKAKSVHEDLKRGIKQHQIETWSLTLIDTVKAATRQAILGFNWKSPPNQAIEPLLSSMLRA